MENKRYLFRGFYPDENGNTTITLNGEKIKGEWVEDECYHHYRGNGIWGDSPKNEIYFVGGIVCIPETIGQWVMADKDDNDIFEGDIIGIHQFLFDGSEHENELFGRVVWDEERVCWAVDHIDHKQIQRYMSYDDDVEFEKVKIPLCELYGLHEESYQRIGNSWEVQK